MMHSESMRISRAIVIVLVCMVAAPVAQAQARAFRATTTPIPKAMRTAMTGVSWHKGCPVGLGSLRLITSTYHRPDGSVATGQLIVHRDVAAAVRRILRRLWRLDYPIARMERIDAFGGDDWESIEANNTSAFNCRAATGSTRWSNHAYGYAIDINPIENPWIENGRVFHKASKPYIDRTIRKSPLQILPGDAVVRAFAAEGWGWGGNWSGSTIDPQHFSVNGR